MQALVGTGKTVELREVDEPSPTSKEALVEIRALAINRGELRLMSTRPDGWRPGQDIAGVVVRPAADGSGPAVGARIVALVDQAGWAQRVAVPVSRLAVLAEAVSFVAAATLPIAGLTALRCLRLGGFLLGQRVLVTGAAGGVGHFAVQLAARAGARVTAVVGRPERGTWLERARAAEVVVGPENLSGPFDLALESVGGAYLAAAIRAAADDGLVVVFGNSSGEQTPLSFRELHGTVQVRGFGVYRSGEPPTFGEDLNVLASLIAAGDLDPEVGFEGSWRNPDAAFAALGERRVNGKAVLTVD
jgi:NADPH:quinone reductase-like Zn-dependent oxidoreductase